MLSSYREVPNQPSDEPEEPRATSWRPVDLTDALAGRDLPAPELLARADLHHLLYRARTHWFQGESESCKSWLALVAAAQILTQPGGRVLWIDYEDDDRGIVARLLALGVRGEDIAAGFVYVRPDEPLRARNGAWTDAVVDFEHLLACSYDLAVIDGVTEAMVTEGLSLMDNADIAAWLRTLPKRIADRTGAAVVCIDHVTKDRDGQGRYAIGGQHKLAGVTGAAYKLEVRRRLRRADGGEPVDGTVLITVVKDRPGWVRAHAADGDAVGMLKLTSWPDGGVTAAVEAVSDMPTPDLVLCRRILEHLLVYDGVSGRNVEDGVQGKGPAIREALRWMAEPPREWLRVEKKGVAHLHFLTDVGREEFGL